MDMPKYEINNKTDSINEIATCFDLKTNNTIIPLKRSDIKILENTETLTIKSFSRMLFKRVAWISTPAILIDTGELLTSARAVVDVAT